jgi:tetratricopeptide (TPR) repeat protein
MYLVALSLLAAGASAASVAAPAPPAKLTTQQQFDAGADAILARDWQKAFDIYQALEVAVAARSPAAKSLPVIRIRKAHALSYLGRLDEAEALIMASIGLLPADDSNLAPDRQQALIVLGDIAEQHFDYPGAVAHFRAALSASVAANEKTAALVRLSRAGIFVDPASALKDADSGLAVLASATNASKEWQGLLHDVRGRVLLNLGRIKEARTEFSAAIKFLGSLDGGKINILDASARSDAAIAALRDDDPVGARKLIAYSGAAQQSYEQFHLGRDMEPPPCALNGPKPEDVAVVEFSIRDDGSVGFARPVYFSGKPSAAVEFARAVSGWSWAPEQLAKISKFFRIQTRMELRCSTVFQRPNAITLLEPAFQQWLAELRVVPLSDGTDSDARNLTNLKSELARRQSISGTNSVQLIPLLVALQKNSVVEWEPSEVYATRAYNIAQTAKMPPQVLAYLGLGRWQYFFARMRSGAFDKYRGEIDAAVARPEIMADPQAVGALTIALFDTTPLKQRDVRGRAALQALVDDKRLAANDPYRVGALTRLANLDYKAGRIEAARANFEKTGLSAQQCSLVDARPIQVKGRLSEVDYPDGAREWGFSGWSVIEFDIDAAGIPIGHRAVASFPPFIFGSPLIKSIQRFRYEQTYRPGGGVGCSGMRFAQYFRYSFN